MRNQLRTAAPGFTLIELLVVVGIVAILAAIAIPNLLAAQTRSKVARAKADLRTLATALEAYTADYSVPPLDYNVSRGDPMLPGMEPSTSGILHPGRSAADGIVPGLTTPVAYVAQVWLDDPFVGSAGVEQIPFDQQKFTYNWFQPSTLRGVPARPEYLFQEYDKFYGAWRLGSIGPDRDFYNGDPDRQLYNASKVYDPTNGTVSPGNIWRSQSVPEMAARPPYDEIVSP